jgi:hypothetical protein
MLRNRTIAIPLCWVTPKGVIEAMQSALLRDALAAAPAARRTWWWVNFGWLQVVRAVRQNLTL